LSLDELALKDYIYIRKQASRRETSPTGGKLSATWSLPLCPPFKRHFKKFRAVFIFPLFLSGTMSLPILIVEIIVENFMNRIYYLLSKLCYNKRQTFLKRNREREFKKDIEARG